MCNILAALPVLLTDTNHVGSKFWLSKQFVFRFWLESLLGLLLLYRCCSGRSGIFSVSRYNSITDTSIVRYCNKVASSFVEVDMWRCVQD